MEIEIQLEPEIDKCKHDIKIYDSKTLDQEQPEFEWQCGRCGDYGIEDESIEFIYTYDQIKTIRSKWDPEFNEE